MDYSILIDIPIKIEEMTDVDDIMFDLNGSLLILSVKIGDMLQEHIIRVDTYRGHHVEWPYAPNVNDGRATFVVRLKNTELRFMRINDLRMREFSQELTYLMGF
jgi:pyruvate formate-lyase activating enzyme-like uncharacterized protein